MDADSLIFDVKVLTDGHRLSRYTRKRCDAFKMSYLLNFERLTENHQKC